MPKAIVSKMRYRAVIERDQAQGTDAWGNAPAPDWQEFATARCAFFSRSKREAIDEDKTVYIEDFRVIMPLQTDITEHDRIEKITDRLGETIVTGPFSVQTIQRHVSHLEVPLQKIHG